MTNIEKKNNRPHDCDRKEDLVAYLYDEVSASERVAFERHLDDCDSCRGEFNAFGRLRDDLGAWQVGFTPCTEIPLPESKMGVLREFISMFPAWARGAALTAAAASLLLFALSFAGNRISLGGKSGTGDLQAAMTSEQVETLIKEVVAKERAQMREEYRAQMAGFEEQIKAEHQAQLQEVKASLKAEIKKSNRQNSSIRSFFALDDTQDPFGDIR